MADSDSFYQEVVLDVNQVIDDLGTSYTIRGRGTYDPNSLSTGSGSTRSADGLVAERELANALAGKSGGEENNDWMGKRTLILKANADPKPQEEIQVDGKWYPLNNLKPIKPADVVVVYMLDVSR